MKITRLHEWNLSPRDAIRLQCELRSKVVPISGIADVGIVAGIDASVSSGDVVAAVAILSYPALEILEVTTARQQVRFPYVPGLLSFREAPAIMSALEAVRIEPDLVVVDGHAVAHPRRFGLGAHIGLLVDKPTFGCAKSRLVGTHASVGERPGDFQYLMDGGEIIGAVVRTKARANPVYVSIGHKIDLDSAVRYLLATTDGYRLPEPIRQAHIAAGRKLVGLIGQDSSKYAWGEVK